MAADQATRDRVRRATERAAHKYRINPRYFDRQIDTESHFDPNAGSPAGAQGPAQFMPGTAAGMGVNLHDGRVTDDLEGAAKLMRQYLDKYGGSYAKALTAYNAGPGRVGKPLFDETANYIKKILGGGDVTDASQGGGASGATPAHVQYGTDQATVQDPELQRQQFFANWLAKKNPNSPLLRLGAVNPQMATTKTVDIPRAMGVVGGAPVTSSRPRTVVGRAGRGKVSIAPGANRAGAGLKPILTNFVSDVAGRAQRPLTVGTGTNHNRLTVDGNVSDHWDGHGADLPQAVDSRQGDLVAAHALQAAGVPWGRALSMAQRGGLFNVTPTSGPYKGRRIQVIWKTNQGGNHHNHVHVGIR